uniref:Uncharacterized protein n=1 Tax=Caenorhabditis japonica TaxID=281687 RepID=A0A8R1IPK2_CAEJA
MDGPSENVRYPSGERVPAARPRCLPRGLDGPFPEWVGRAKKRPPWRAYSRATSLVPAGQWTFDTAGVDTCHILMRTINAEMSETTTTTNFGII